MKMPRNKNLKETLIIYKIFAYHPILILKSLPLSQEKKKKKFLMKVNYTFQQIIIYHCMQRFTTTQDDSAIRQSWLNYNQVQLQFILTISSYKSNSPLFQSHYKQIIRQKHSRDLNNFLSFVTFTRGI